MNKMFFAKEGQKVTEKYLHRVLATSICGILLCMCCFVSTTWAWYNLSISNQGNVIQVGVFDVSVTVKHAEGAENGQSVDGKVENGVYLYELPAGKYTVTIESTEKNTVSGHCVVKLGDNPEKIARISQNEATFRFTVEVPQPQSQDDVAVVQEGTEQRTLLEIRPVWGNVTVEEGMLIANEESAEKDTAVPEQSDDMENTDEEENSVEESLESDNSESESSESQATDSPVSNSQSSGSQIPDSQIPDEPTSGTESAVVESTGAADSGQGGESVPTESSSDTTGEQSSFDEG